MSIPIAFQQFKSAGIYRVVYDRSTILNSEFNTQIMRLVVGYSPKGPFNIPVLIRSISEFKAMFGEGSKSLEKRGVYFHKIALQCLNEAPIICLNLKRFSGETVYGATVDTSFNPSWDIIDTVELNVEDIYDTTRFWELSAFKLAEIRDVTGKALDSYISLSATNTKETSISFFMRKASGSKVAQYNVTVSDWYKDAKEEIPDFLMDKQQNKMSDFFAEIYIFKGKFTADQVLSSETLKNYFQIINDATHENVLALRPYVTNAFGDAIDSLDALYNDNTSGAIAHYVGSLIPYMRDKYGNYVALDILVNNDIEQNNLMMNFDVDRLEDGMANIDLSGRTGISVGGLNGLSVDALFAGEAVSSLLGNKNAPVVSDEIEFSAEFRKTDSSLSKKRITGNFYASAITAPTDEANGVVTLTDMNEVENPVTWVVTSEEKTEDEVVYAKIKSTAGDEEWVVASEAAQIVAQRNAAAEAPVTLTVNIAKKYWDAFLTRFGINSKNVYDEETGELDHIQYYGGIYREDYDFDSFKLPESCIISVTNHGQNPDPAAKNVAFNYSPYVGFTTTPVGIASSSKLKNADENHVYDTSVTFIPQAIDWQFVESYDGAPALISSSNNAMSVIMEVGDCLLAADGSTDTDGDEEQDPADGFYDNVYVLSIGNNVDKYGVVTYYIKLTGQPLLYDGGYYVRITNALNQEIGEMVPVYLEGYTYFNPKPASTGMYDKQKWQDFILSTLTDYKGIRTGLLSVADCDYRYLIDTFETYVTIGAKNVLSFLAKQKELCFAILNFPSVRTFVKCPYTSFTDSKGVFNVDYVVKGYNPKKAHSLGFSLPSESEGASFCAFYTPLKYTDGYVDSIIPSAGIVSNLYIQKYRTRQPYEIIAGPNYGSISASSMVGPDYNYSRDELNVIEPYGVNCLVYNPTFGTFINANQTAKQTPKSALSSINVRELVIYLQDEIGKVLQSFQWEFNNQTVRNKIKDKADIICQRVMANGGLQDFVNVMDESNNTPDIIDNEMAVLSTHIEPGRGMGKMIHELTIYRTGAMRAAISEL